MSEGERRRVLDLLAGGKITVDEATALLTALAGGTRTDAAPPPPPPRGRGRARLLRISIDASGSEGSGEAAKVRVNVPIALARFATRLLPPEAKRELDAQGIDLDAMLAALGEELPDGKLVDIDVSASDDGREAARIVVEAI